MALRIVLDNLDEVVVLLDANYIGMGDVVSGGWWVVIGLQDVSSKECLL